MLVTGTLATFLALGGGIVATARQAWLKEDARAGESAAKTLALQRADDAIREKDAAEEARKLADAARVDAEMRLEEAQAVRKFLQHVIAAARGEVLGRDVTVVDALAHAANAVSKEFEGRPLVEAAVRLALGKTYQSLAMNDEAREQLARALELRVGHLDENHVLIAEARRALGVSHLAAGDFSKAEPLIERAVAGYRRTAPRATESTLPRRWRTSRPSARSAAT